MTRTRFLAIATFVCSSHFAFAQPGASSDNPAPTQPQQNAPDPQPGTGNAAPAVAPDVFNNAQVTDLQPKDGVSPALLRAEVMLDRLHASPGVIDGRDGQNLEHALQNYEKSRDLKLTRSLGEEVWASLVRESGETVITKHVLSDKDVEGPFYPDLPKDYAELAKLPTIGYRTPVQKIAEMFHMSEALLTTLNPGADFAKAGTELLVAKVDRTPVTQRIKTIAVDKTKGQVLAYDAKGDMILSYPATIGSTELPSPSGSYRIKGVAFNPVYYYDPDKNFVQGDNQEKLKLPPGPNNPVGSVFIALTKPTYGLHGTPDPEKIDKAASHGCVRMTNWDANELAHLVKPGLVVRFKGEKA